jgi:hypothetical protein
MKNTSHGISRTPWNAAASITVLSGVTTAQCDQGEFIPTRSNQLPTLCRRE